MEEDVYCQSVFFPSHSHLFPCSLWLTSEALDEEEATPLLKEAVALLPACLLKIGLTAVRAPAPNLPNMVYILV